MGHTRSPAYGDAHTHPCQAPHDWLLEWTPDTGASPGQQGIAGPIDSSAPGVFTALEQQLGLRLEPGKAPMELVIVDDVERPSAN
jgi:uncharacterized protein (TIGR03435 family)